MAGNWDQNGESGLLFLATGMKLMLNNSTAK